MATRTRKRRRLAAEINVVPYIDVMLVLLIIFMVTAPLMKTAVEVDLPNAAARPMAKGNKAQPIVVTVKKDGQLYLNVAPNPEQSLPPAKLKRIAHQAIVNHPNAPVSVKGAGDGQYGDVVRAMVLLQRAGAQTIGLQTENVASTPAQSENANTSSQGVSG